jgi:hypothetical protein
LKVGSKLNFQAVKTNARPKLVFVLSDLHCGSTLAVIPPGFQTLEMLG